MPQVIPWGVCAAECSAPLVTAPPTPAAASTSSRCSATSAPPTGASASARRSRRSCPASSAADLRSSPTTSFLTVRHGVQSELPRHPNYGLLDAMATKRCAGSCERALFRPRYGIVRSATCRNVQLGFCDPRCARHLFPADAGNLGRYVGRRQSISTFGYCGILRRYRNLGLRVPSLSVGRLPCFACDLFVWICSRWDWSGN